MGETKINKLKICRSDIGALVAAACLAHDIGNPPFGHSGEDAISYYFNSDFDNGFKPPILSDVIKVNRNGSLAVSIYGEKQNWPSKDIIENTKKWNDLINFEGNANGFRILTQNCTKGINPTSALLGVFSKYPCESYLVDHPYEEVEKKIGQSI